MIVSAWSLKRISRPYYVEGEPKQPSILIKFRRQSLEFEQARHLEIVRQNTKKEWATLRRRERKGEKGEKEGEGERASKEAGAHAFWKPPGGSLRVPLCVLICACMVETTWCHWKSHQKRGRRTTPGFQCREYFDFPWARVERLYIIHGISGRILRRVSAY